MSSSPEPDIYRAPSGRSVQDMFGAIAGRYDLLNHVLSLSVDRYWRRQTVRLMRSFGPDPGDCCLDVCTGTGDLLIEIHRRLGLRAHGADFCRPMLERASVKLGAAGLQAGAGLAAADALALPFADGAFRFVTIAFGLRNLEVMKDGLREMHRVLCPGGTLVVLEFSRPRLPVFSSAFNFYFSYILPRLGRWISGTEGAYQYLPDSVARFPSQAELAGMIERTGFGNVRYRNLTGGIAALHWGSKP